MVLPAQFAGNNTTLRNSLPADATCAPTNCAAGATITWSPGTIPAGGVYVASFKTTLATGTSAPPPASLIPLSAHIRSGTQPLATGSTQVRARPTGVLNVLRLGASSQVVKGGERIAVTASYGNLSATSISQNNQLSVQLPVGLSVVDAAGGQVSGRIVTWPLGTINPGLLGERTLIAEVGQDAAPGLVAVQSTLQNGSESTEGHYVLAVHPAPALRVTVESDVQTLERGRQFAVRIRATNEGDVALSNVVVTGRSTQASGGPVMIESGGTCASCGADREVRWTLPSLSPGESRTFSYSAATSNTAAVLINSGLSQRQEAFAAAGGQRVFASNDQRLEGTRDLETGLGGTDRLAYGQPTELEIHGANLRTSNVTAVNTRLVLHLPPGVTVLDADGASQNGNRLEWNLGSLSPGRFAFRHPVVQAEPVASGEPAPPGMDIFSSGFETGEEPGDGGPGGGNHHVSQGLMLVRIADDNGAQTEVVQTVTLGAPAPHVTLALSVTPNPVQRGEIVNGQITLGNQGPALTGVKLHIRLPGEVSSNGGGISVIDVGDLPSGATRVTSFASMIANSSGYPPNGSVIEFEAWATDANNRDVARARDLVTVIGKTLEVAMEADRDPIISGDTLTYTLTYGNAAATASTGTMLSLPLPPGVVFEAASDGGTLSSDVVTWNLGTLQPGAAGQRTLRVAVPDAVPGELLTTRATLAGGGNVAYADLATAQATQRQLNLAVAVTPNPARRGELVHGEVTLGNSGADLFGVAVTLRVPQELATISYGTFVSDGGVCAGSYCEDGELLVWSLGDLPAGTTRTLSFVAAVNNDAGPYPSNGALIEFEAIASSVTNGEMARTRDVVLVRDKMLDVAVEDDRNPVVSGDTLTYTLSYGNASAGGLNGVTLSLPLPPETVFGAASEDGTHTGGVVTWNLGTLQPGASGQRTVSVVVPTAVPGKLLETRASLIDGSGNAAHADLVTAQAAQRTLHLAVVTTPNPAQRGQFLNGEVTVANSGADMFGVQIYLRVPQELATLSYGTLVSDGGVCVGGYCEDGELITWNIGDLPSGTTRTLSVAFTVNNESGPYPQTGSLIEFAAWAADASNPHLTRARGVVPVGNKVLDLAVEDDRNPVISGDVLTYTLSYGNATASGLTDVILSLPLPPGTVFASASDGGTQANGVATWNLGVIPPGASGQRLLRVNVPTAVPGKLLETRARLADGAGNVAYFDVVTAQAAQRTVDLAVSITPNPAQRGQLVHGEVVIGNSGGDLFGVKVYLRVPQALATISYNTDVSDGGVCPGNWCEDGELLTWNIGNLPAGTTRTFNFVASVNNESGPYPATGSLIGFTAWAADATNPHLIRARDVAAVGNKALNVAIEDDGEPVISGDTLTYVISYGNASASTLPGATLSLPVPAGTAFNAASGGGVHSNGVVSWNLGTLTAGASGEVTTSVTVPAATPGRLFETRALLADGAGTAAYADTITAQAAQRPLSLTLALAPNPAARNAAVNAQIVLSNSGPALFGVQVLLRIPQELATISYNTDVSDGGTCPGNWCEDGELLTWSIGDLPTGAMRILTFTATINNQSGYPPSGELIEFDAWVTELLYLDTARARDVIRVQ